MPQIGAHLVIAELLIDPPSSLTTRPANPLRSSFATQILQRRDLRTAYNLGAVGPDLLYFMTDNWLTIPKVGGTNPIISFVDRLTDCYKVIQDAKSVYARLDALLLEPVDTADDAINHWFDGGASEEARELKSEGYRALLLAAEMLVLADESLTIPNPAAGLGIPGFSNAPDITLESQGLNTGYLRTWGHPYTSEMGNNGFIYKEAAPNPSSIDPNNRDHSDLAERRRYEKGWWWADLLHNRRSGLFAERLLKSAPGDLERAYALGYFTHVAGDICGHPYVNTVVGGPYRHHVIRHLVMENVIDSWVWDKFSELKVVNGSDLVDAHLHTAIDVRPFGPDDPFVRIAKHLINTMNEVYLQGQDAHGTPLSRIAPSLIPGSVPSSDDIGHAYRMLLTILEHATTAGIEAPQPPSLVWPDQAASDPVAALQALRNEMDGEALDAFNRATAALGTAAAGPPAPGSSPEAAVSWIIAPFVGGVWALVFLTMVLTYGPAAINRMRLMPKRWLIYFMRLAIYQFVRMLLWKLALNGFGKVSRADLNNQFALSCWRLPARRTRSGAFRYSFQKVPHTRTGFWLRDPADFVPSVAREVFALSPAGTWMGAESCPYPVGATPDVFITGPRFDLSRKPDLVKFASAQRPEESLIVETETFKGPQLGNAVEFSRMLIDGDYPAGAFDLDADLGYGFLGWEGPLGVPPRYGPLGATVL
jgi:hypothetical protein